MKLSINCSGNNRKLLEELLAARGIGIDETASVSIIEKGYPVPKNGLAIFFDPHNLNELLEFFDELRPLSPQRNENEMIVGKRNDSYELVKFDEVVYFEADGNNTYCQTGNQRFEVKKKLYELENELGDKGFIRVNKSYLINIMMVREIIPWFGSRLLLKFKNILTEIEVSRKSVPVFKKFIDM